MFLFWRAENKVSVLYSQVWNALNTVILELHCLRTVTPLGGTIFWKILLVFFNDFLNDLILLLRDCLSLDIVGRRDYYSPRFIRHYLVLTEMEILSYLSLDLDLTLIENIGK